MADSLPVNRNMMIFMCDKGLAKVPSYNFFPFFFTSPSLSIFKILRKDRVTAS